MEELAQITSPLTRSRKRQLGSYYTPPEIVRSMVGGCLSKAFLKDLKVLDPACGDGEFLIGVAEHLANGRKLSAKSRLGLVRRHLHGVDVDPAAIEAAHLRLREWICPQDEDLSRETDRILAANICLGDALTGNDFSDSHAEQNGFSFCVAFPEVARRGGFDVVLGNPPYRRELSAKGQFDQIAESPLGRKWREPRMDLWYYFLHRGLDLLRPGGTLSFIVNSYWTASSGAQKMIGRLEEETALEEITLLGNRKIFAGVSGRHLIFRLRKARHNKRCKIINRDAHGESETENAGESSRSVDHFTVSQKSLYAGGRIMLSPPTPIEIAGTSDHILSDYLETSQGLAENPPRVQQKHLDQLDDGVPLGAGVFVLTYEELLELRLNRQERKLLRPYYETSVLGRYQIPLDDSHQLLYLTRETAPTLEGLPNIERHLERFRPILEQRRETRLGRRAWWHLHWPRQEKCFHEAKVLCIQMGRRPSFLFAANPAYVGFSVNLIRDTTYAGWSLPSLTGILNSTCAAQWFERHAKRRGVNLEINLNVLRQFPLPPFASDQERELTKLVIDRQDMNEGPTSAQQEARIDEIVAGLYGISTNSRA